VAAALSLILLTIRFHLRFLPTINKQDVQKVWKYSLGNYAAGFFSMLTGTIAPILITNKLGPEATAFYYMPSMILSLINSIPRSTASSMFAEGSTDTKQLRNLFFRSLRAIYTVLFPAILIIFFLGEYILLSFGKRYSIEGVNYLKYVAISILIAAPNQLFAILFNIKKKVKLVLVLSIANALIGLLLIWFLLPYGITVLGIASIIGQTISLVLYLVAIKYLIN
jgi:O-antigen/teichoic acid export membrane protein